MYLYSYRSVLKEVQQSPAYSRVDAANFLHFRLVLFDRVHKLLALAP